MLGGNIGVAMLKRIRQYRLVCAQIVAVSFLLFVSQVRAQEPSADSHSSTYEEAMDNRLYGEAEVSAKGLIELAIREGRQDDLSMAGLLVDLASAQRMQGNHGAALQNYEQAVGLIEANANMLDPALVEPLHGMGRSHIDNGRADLALPLLDRAIHVRHVNDGPHSLKQEATLESLVAAYLQLGKLDEAAGVADTLFLLYGRNFPGESMALVPALLKKGEILGQIGDRREERNTYNEAVKIVEMNSGKSSAELVRPFIRLGASHENEYFDLYMSAESEEDVPDDRLLSKAESFYESALELARSNDDVAWQTHADAVLSLGDFYTITEQQSRARVLYRDAWQLLTADEARLERRRVDLEGVVLLQRSLPDLTVALPDDYDSGGSTTDYATGHIVTQFTVTRRGRLADISLVEISPERNSNIEAEVKLSLTSHLYRPRFENGTAVDTFNQTIRYEFPYPTIIDAAE